MKIEYLLSGLCGALIVTIFNYIVEQVRYRKEAMIEVVKWEDRIRGLLQLLHVYKNKFLSGQGQGLNLDDYKAITRELTPLLTSSKIITLINLAYGDGEELRQVNKVQNEFIKVSSLLRKADKTTWDKVNNEVMNYFKEKIDPLRVSVRLKLIKGTRIEEILYSFCRSNLPTACNILSWVRLRFFK